MDATTPNRLTALLASPRVGLLAVCIAVVLSLPSIPTGWYLDDLVHRAQFLEVGPMTDSSDMTHRMFDFLSGDPEEILAYKDLGVLPWWSEDELKFRFWRPLSSFTHVVDYTLWPASGVLMHVHNVAWLAGLVAVTALLYRRLIAIPMIAGLATLLYALDDAHGMPAAFLANRNAMVAASFGVLSLWLHDRFRRDGWAPGGILSPLAFLAALLGGESGIGIAPYLLGYAIFMERRSGAARFATIAPHAVVGIAWLVFYKSGGYGTFGSGFYLDPMDQKLLIVNAPSAFYGQYTLLVRTFDAKPTPQSMLMLAPGTTSLTLERPSANTLSIEAESGWLDSPFDIVYRTRTRAFPENYQVQLADVRIQVVALTRDGRPRKVSFTFERELEDESLRWVAYEDGRYVPFEVPAVGGSAVIEAVAFSFLSPPSGLRKKTQSEKQRHPCMEGSGQREASCSA